MKIHIDNDDLDKGIHLHNDGYCDNCCPLEPYSATWCDGHYHWCLQCVYDKSLRNFSRKQKLKIKNAETKEKVKFFHKRIGTLNQELITTEAADDLQDLLEWLNDKNLDADDIIRRLYSEEVAIHICSGAVSSNWWIGDEYGNNILWHSEGFDPIPLGCFTEYSHLPNQRSYDFRDAILQYIAENTSILAQDGS